jgi:hypothetical protein
MGKEAKFGIASAKRLQYQISPLSLLLKESCRMLSEVKNQKQTPREEPVHRIKT